MASKVALALIFACVIPVEASEDTCLADVQEDVSSPECSSRSSLLQTSFSMGKASTRDAAGQELSDTMAKLASSLLDGPTKQLLHSFKICTECQNAVRWGEEHDGGYVTCHDGLEHGKIQAAYSMGVDTHDKWSDDVYNALKVPVNQFDCTVDKPAQRCPDCHFFKACLSAPGGKGGMPNHTSWDLETALAKTGQENAADRSLLMKMDIEGAEWLVYSSPSGSALKKFQEIIVEFHDVGHESKHLQYLKAVQTILMAGFQVAHVHGNNCCGSYTKGEYSLPEVVEVTFVAGGQALPHCKDPRRGPLDQTNLRNREELTDPVLP